MIALHALKAARDAGIRIGIDGDALIVDADAARPTRVMDSRNDSWSSDDWRAFFDERAAIAEFDGGLPRDQADARAFACCVAEWLDRNPVRSPPGRCLSFGGSEHVHDSLQRFGTEHAGGAWLHPNCWEAWDASRTAEAIATLSEMDISVSRIDQ